MLELWDRLPPSVRGTLRTLVTIALNGGAAALGAVVIDPDHFSLAHLKHIGIVFAAGALAAVINWLRQSPWKKTDDNLMNSIARSVPNVLFACVLAGAAALSMPACGSKQMHTAVVANTTLAQAIFAVQDAEIAAHDAKLITDERHAGYKKQILLLLNAGDDLTVALQRWDPAQPAPANIGKAIGEVQQLLSDLKLESPQATNLLFAVQTVLSVLRGSGVLPSDAAANGLFRLFYEQHRGADAAQCGEPFSFAEHTGDLDVGAHAAVLDHPTITKNVGAAKRRGHALILLPAVAEVGRERAGELLAPRDRSALRHAEPERHAIHEVPGRGELANAERPHLLKNAAHLLECATRFAEPSVQLLERGADGNDRACVCAHAVILHLEAA